MANASGDMANATKQANEFGLTHAGQTVVSLLTFITDVNSVGLKAAQGLTFVTAFYWDRDDESRAWSKRFFELHKRKRQFAVDVPGPSSNKRSPADCSPRKMGQPWLVVQGCYAAFLSDPAPEWLIKGGVITEDQRGDAAAILRSISDWLERAQRLLTLPRRQRSLGYERRRSRSRCGVSEGDPEADADQPDYGPEVELVSVEEAHHKSHDHNDDRGNSNPFPFLAIVRKLSVFVFGVLAFD